MSMRKRTVFSVVGSLTALTGLTMLFPAAVAAGFYRETASVQIAAAGLLSMATVFRLWLLAIAVQMCACFILLLGVVFESARRDLVEFLSACCALVQVPLNTFGPIVLQPGKKPS